jgi:hypothetical protein
VKKNKDKLVALQEEMFKMNLASAKAALKLDKAGFKAYKEKAAAANEKQGKLRREIMQEMQRIGKIESVKEIQAQIMKETTSRMAPLIKEFREINKKIVEKLQ